MTNKKSNKIIILLAIVLAVSAAAALILKIPSRAYRKIKDMSNKDVNVCYEKIDIDGYEGNFKIIYIADSHIALCDDRDEELKEQAAGRYDGFIRNQKGPDRNFSITVDRIVKEEPDLVIFGGDIIDEATKANTDFLEKELSKLDCPYIYLMGNHDFEYNGEYFTEKAYAEYLPRLSSVNGEASGIEVLRYDDFTILALDDNNYQVPAGTSEVLKILENEGKPVIAALHSPIVPKDGAELIAKTNEVWPPAYLDFSRVLMGEHANLPNDETAEFIDFVSKNEGVVWGVLAGHIHFSSKDRVNEHAWQFVAPAGYERGFIEIVLE